MATRRAHIRASAEKTPPPSNTGVLNHLLGALPSNDLKRLLPTLDVIPLKLKQVIFRPGEQLTHVYFPGGGFCSEVATLRDGSMVEVATIGREGMIGISAVLEGPAAALAMVQAEMPLCYRMPLDVFRREMARREVFNDLLTRYALVHMAFIIQSTACNAVHTVEQRLARWLLLAQDRVGHRDFPLTQEFVAMMLGVVRPTVTVVAGTLQKAGLITYRHGHVTIVDREELEAASCECYRTVTDLLRSLTIGVPGS